MKCICRVGMSPARHPAERREDEGTWGRASALGSTSVRNSGKQSMKKSCRDGARSCVGRGAALWWCLGAGGDMEGQHWCEKDQSQLLPQPHFSQFTGIRGQQAWGEGSGELR